MQQQQQQVAWDKALQADAKEAFAVLNNRLDQGFNSLNEVTNHFGARAKLETEYANNFSGILKSTAFKADQGSLKDALDKLIASSDSLSSLHVAFAKKLINDVDVPLNKFKQTQRALKKHHETEIDKASKAAAKEVANVEKIKKDYYAKCNGMKQAVLVAAKGQTDKMTKKEYEKIQEKAIKAKKDVDSSENDYRAAVKKYEEVQDALDQTLVVACREIQANENERYQLIQSTLAQLIEAHIQMLSEQSAKAYQEALQAVKKINTTADLNDWAAKSSAGSTKTARLTFQSFFGEKKTLNRVASQKNISQQTSPVAEVAPKNPIMNNVARSVHSSTSNLAKAKVVNAEPVQEPAQVAEQAVPVAAESAQVQTEAPVQQHQPEQTQQQSERKLTVETKPTEAERQSYMQKPEEQKPSEEPVKNAAPLDSGVAVSPEEKKGSLTNVAVATEKKESKANLAQEKAESKSNLAQESNSKSAGKLAQYKEPVAAPQPEAQKEEAKPVEAKPVEVKPAEVKPVEAAPVEVKPVEAKTESKAEEKQSEVMNAAASTNSNLKERQFTRRSIKMEGWLDVCDDSNKTWVKRWCALEGGYIWFFESQADNSKAQGQNKPKSMASVAKSTITKGNAISGWTVPDVASKGDNLLTLVIGGKRQMLLACPDADDNAYWFETIEAINKSKK